MTKVQELFNIANKRIGGGGLSSCVETSAAIEEILLPMSLEDNDEQFEFDVDESRFAIVLNPKYLSVSVHEVEINDEDAEYADTNLGEDARDIFNACKGDWENTGVAVSAQRNSNGFLIINIFGITGRKAACRINNIAAGIARRWAFDYFGLNAIGFDSILENIEKFGEDEAKVRRLGLSAGLFNTVKFIERYVEDNLNMEKAFP
jgi:hypothetical protein